MLRAINQPALSVDRAAQSMDPLIAQDMLYAGDLGLRDQHFWVTFLDAVDVMES